MLQRLKLRNFKSFIDQEIELGPLVVLVGANASGKSNLFDAIRFLQGVGLGMTFTEILRGRYEGGREIWPGIRGGIHEAATKGRNHFMLDSAWTTEEKRPTNHHLEVEVNGGPNLHRESLGAAGDWLLDTHAESLGSQAGASAGSIKLATRRTGSGKGHHVDLRSDRSVLGQLRETAKMRNDVEPSARALLELMRSSTFLDITPSRMRGYVSAAESRLGSEGENLSAVLRSLCEDPERKQTLIDWLSELCAPELVDLDFVETELGDVMLELVEPGGTKIPARSLSDGTLRFLGQLIALETAEPDSLLLIEEVDSGLHPQRVHLLVEALEIAARERDVQVLATTHSPLVLAALSQESLRDAVLCARSEEMDPADTEGANHGTVLRRLGDLPHFDEIADRRGVDQLMITGWLERAL